MCSERQPLPGVRQLNADLAAAYKRGRYTYVLGLRTPNSVVRVIRFRTYNRQLQAQALSDGRFYDVLDNMAIEERY